MKKLFIKTRTAILVFLTHQLALPILKRVRKPAHFTCTREQLKELPMGSLGNDLYLFLEKRGLPFLSHYARHDLKHVLLKYDTTDEGEACLQSFMFGNGRISFPVLATILYCFFTMPEHWKKMIAAYQLGKKSDPIHRWSWNDILMEPTYLLRDRIFNHT